MPATLAFVTGPPGAGKTTLAHRLAALIACPAICRDEVRAGQVRAQGGAAPDMMAANLAFFEVLSVLGRAGVTTVAEAAFQHTFLRPRLEELATVFDLRIVRCTVAAAVSRQRVRARLAADPVSRAAHGDHELLSDPEAGRRMIEDFRYVEMAAPMLAVSTDDGYEPALETIVSFVAG